MIEVVVFPNVFDSLRRETSLVMDEGAVELRDLMPSGWDLDDPRVHAFVGGIERSSGVVEPGSQVVVTRIPGLAVIAEWAWYNQVLFAIAMMAASAVITKALAPKADKAVEEDNKSESFKGFQNSYFSGGAISLIYGERRIAPPVVGQIIESSFAAWSLSSRETMRLLLAVCHGPIAGFGDVVGSVATNADFIATAAVDSATPYTPLLDRIGLKLNGHDATNFSDVLVEWRTGEFEQDPLPGFPDSSVDIPIDLALAEYSTTIDISEASKPSGSLTPGNEIDSTLGESLSHTMTNKADRFALTLSFVAGIYKSLGGGGTSPSTASFRIQYWPVDAVGTRTGDTVLLPEIHITGDNLTAQIYQILATLFDPSSYVGATQFGYVKCFSTNKHVRVVAPVDAATFPDSFNDPGTLAFSAQGWARARSNFPPRCFPIFESHQGVLSSSLSSIQFWPWYPEGNTTSQANAGVMFSLDWTIPNISDPPGYRLCLYAWSGKTRRCWYSPIIDPASSVTDTWNHYGVSWDAASQTAAFYLNGSPLGPTSSVSVGGTPSPVFSESKDFTIGHNGAPSASGTFANIASEVDLVDLVISDGVRDTVWFGSMAGTVDVWGHRSSGIDAANDPAIVFASHLSELLSGSKIEQLTFPGSTTTGKAVEQVGSALAAAPQTDSPLWTPDTGIAMRERYKIELFRSNPVAEDSQVEQNAADWKALSLITDQDFAHPGVTMLGVSVDADDQVGNSRPDVSLIARGIKVPIWTGASEEYPTFDEVWSRNPAWCALHALTEEEVGLGSIWSRYTDIDLAAWKVWADYCDEGVDDAQGVPAFFDGQPVAASSSHPFGELRLRIGLLDASGVATGEVLPKSWVVGHTIRIKTASDSTWTVASSDNSVRLTITKIAYASDTAAPLGSQHWVQVDVDWVTGYTLPTATSVTGTTTGFEARHECDTILDGKDADGWGEVLLIMRAARAAPIIIGNKISVSVDRARDPDFLITQAQMIEGSFSLAWTSADDRPNSVEFEYIDRNQDFVIDTVQWDHPSISGEVDPRKIRKEPPQLLRGVTRRSEVIRQTIYRLNLNFLLRKVCRFSLGTDGLGLAPGDRIRVAHDVPLLGEAGRIFADSASASSIKLDRDVIVTAGKSYEIELRSSGSVTADGLEIRQTILVDPVMVPSSGSTTIAAGSLIYVVAVPGNVLTSPSDFGDTLAWTNTGLTVTADTDVAPDGTTAADTLAYPAGSDPYLQHVDTAITPSNGGEHVTFGYLKKSGSDNMLLDIRLMNVGSSIREQVQFSVSSASGAVSGFVVVVTKDPLAVGYTVADVDVTAFNADWWRVSMSLKDYENTAAKHSLRIFGRDSTGGVTPTRSLIVWGFGLIYGSAAFVPAQGDVYSFGETSLTAEDFTVTSVTLDPTTMERAVEAIEYDAQVFDDNTFGILPTDPSGILPAPPVGGGGGGIKPVDGSGEVIGGAVVAAKERTYLDAGGKPRVALVVSWPASSAADGGVNVWIGNMTDGAIAAPKKVAHAQPGSSSVEVDATQIATGTRIRVHVQALGLSGRGRSAHACPFAELVVGARAFQPAAPTITSPKSRQSNASYAVTFPAGQVPEGVEVRVGGWILGQKVAAALRDGVLVSEQWVFGADNAALDGAYTHQVRSLLPSGQVSAAATFTNDDAVPLGASVSSSTAHEDAWGGGTLTNLVVNADGELEFTGSALEGTFETPALDMGLAKRWLVEVAADASQVHPALLGSMTELAGSRAYANWLGEGPTGGDDALLSRLDIEWTPSDTATPSVTYATLRPGEAYFRAAKFRVKVTRPDATFNCRIKRFGVRVLALPDFEPGNTDGGVL